MQLVDHAAHKLNLQLIGYRIQRYSGFHCSSIKYGMDKQEKPSLPADYRVPEVWNFVEQAGPMGAMNRPTSGARFEKTLPVGKHPIQLYSLGTPNGQKVTILLEELGIEYDAWKISLKDLDQFGSDFVKVNPNSKIPAMMDHSFNPPLRIFESSHILKYLAEKNRRFIPADPRKRVECFNWLFWQTGR